MQTSACGAAFAVSFHGADWDGMVNGTVMVYEIVELEGGGQNRNSWVRLADMGTMYQGGAGAFACINIGRKRRER